MKFWSFWPSAPPGMGSAAGEIFWLRLTTASAQCLRLSERFFSFSREFLRSKFISSLFPCYYKIYKRSIKTRYSDCLNIYCCGYINSVTLLLSLTLSRWLNRPTCALLAIKAPALDSAKTLSILLMIRVFYFPYQRQLFSGFTELTFSKFCYPHMRVDTAQDSYLLSEFL